MDKQILPEFQKYLLDRKLTQEKTLPIMLTGQ